jgi:hypothetical protein
MKNEATYLRNLTPYQHMLACFEYLSVGLVSFSRVSIIGQPLELSHPMIFDEAGMLSQQ